MPSRTPRERKLDEQTRAIGHLIGDQLPPGCGFVLCLFEFGEHGWSTYISNAQRADMIAHLRHLAQRLEDE